MGKANPKANSEKPGRIIGQVKLIAVIALFAGAIKAGQYAGRHLVPLILILASATVLIALAVRPVSAIVNRFGARFIVRSWAPVTSPRVRQVRGLPEPLTQDAPVQAFTGTSGSDAVVSWTSSPARAPGACEGPKCANPLPADANACWRAGSSVPAGASYDDGSPDGAVQIGEIHEFCSEQCTMRWIGAGEQV